MIPVQDSAHSDEMLGLLTEVFKKQPNIEGILKSLAVEIQTLEDQLFVYLAGILLANAVGDVLDKYGAIVGLLRYGRSDADYKSAILLRMRVLRANGRAEDVIQVAALVLTYFEYEEWQPAAFTVLSLDVPNPVPLLSLLGQAKAAGTRGVFLFSTWSHTLDLAWDTSVGSVTADPTVPRDTPTGLKDSVGGTFAFQPVSSQDFL